MKSYLIKIHDDAVTGSQVMKALQKLGCFVEMKDLDTCPEHGEPVSETEYQGDLILYACGCAYPAGHAAAVGGGKLHLHTCKDLG